jgi:alpha-ketoglutarate-dependent taurine dioxygenase
MGMILEDAVAIRKVATTFGAEVSGIPISGDIPAASLARFIDLLHENRMLLVPRIALEPADQVAFSRRLGPLELHAASAAILPAHPEIFCVGNVERDGMKANFARGVEQWHADSSYRAVPSDASLFYGVIVPPEGGETNFLDATAAWEELDPAMQRRVEGLRAVHDLETLHRWNALHTPGRPAYTDAQRRQWPPVSHPLVRTHKVTDKRSLYLCPAVISHIEGMSLDEGRAVIDELMAHANRPRYIYSHRWRAGDLVIWDNRAVLHTASLFDHARYQRLMYRTTVAGDVLGEAA